MKRKTQLKMKAYATVIMVFLVSSFALVAIVAGAGSITLTPTSQAPGGSVTVEGTGFNATKAVGIGFGAEVAVTGEIFTPTGSGFGPYTGTLANRPIKPGTFVMNMDINSGLANYDVVDTGTGVLASNATTFASGTINYVTGQVTTSSTVDASGYTIVRTARYTRYQYNATPAAGVTTSASGSFTANIVVPSVASGNYNVTAIDASGNRAVSSISVVSSSFGWSKTYGGTGNDIGTGDTVQTSDGGYAVSGDTSSSGAGGTDFWLFKTDANGNMLWNKTYGGALDETCGDMCLAGDGGFALAGNTRSFGAEGRDVWLVKTDAAGNMMWNKTYGGTGDDYMLDVIQTSDNGYMMSGYTASFGAGANDAWLIKTDASGSMLWNKTYGGNLTDMGYGVVQTNDGGYTFTGYTSSFGAGGNDAWLVKTDASGNMLWNKTYGGNSTDQTYALARTSDGGYAMAGYTMRGTLASAYLVRTDASGNMLWEKTYRETNSTQIGLHMIKTADEGFAIVGWNYLNAQDFLLIKTDAAGNLQWNMTYGGSGLDNGYALLQTGDGGYVLTGTTASSGAGGSDVWLAKVDAAGVVPEGLAIGVIMLLSSIAAAIGALYRRKPGRITH
jgi:predicted secreted protein